MNAAVSSFEGGKAKEHFDALTNKFHQVTGLTGSLE
jgi:hypothetical protein